MHTYEENRNGQLNERFGDDFSREIRAGEIGPRGSFTQRQSSFDGKRVNHHQRTENTLVDCAEEQRWLAAHDTSLTGADLQVDGADQDCHDDGLHQRSDDNSRLSELLLECTAKENLHLIEPRGMLRQIAHQLQALVHTHVQIDVDGRLVSQDGFVDGRLLLERDHGHVNDRILARWSDDIEKVISRIGMRGTRKSRRAIDLLENRRARRYARASEQICNADHHLFSWTLVHDTSCLE